MCRTLQTVGPSHARTYTVAVYFKGERIGCGKGPRWVKLYHKMRHKRTRRCASLRAANGLGNNGCTLLMVFIIAIKLSLACSIMRDIMQNENESIHYWFDVNWVIETSLCGAVWDDTTQQLLAAFYFMFGSVFDRFTHTYEPLSTILNILDVR